VAQVSRLSNQQLAAPKSRYKNSSCGMIVDPASTSLDIHLGLEAAGRWSRSCEVESLKQKFN
jgi:hypothetical protein